MIRTGLFLCILVSTLPNFGAAQTDFWQPTGGPLGGMVLTSITKSNGIVLLGTYGAGVFRSTDNGQTWKAANTGLSAMTSYAIAENSAGTTFVGTSLGVFVSTDNCGTWSRPFYDSRFYNISSMVINASGIVYAATYSSGIWRSADNGTTWAQVNNGLLINTTIQSIAVRTSGELFAGTYGGGVFRSVDGTNWSQINSGLANLNITALLATPAGRIFAGTGGGGLWCLDPNATTWVDVSPPNLWISSLSLNSGGHIFALCSSMIYRSTNNGASWSVGGTSQISVRMRSLCFTQNGNMILTTEGQGVFLSSDDGSTWTPANNGLVAHPVFSLAVSRDSSIYAGTWCGGVYRTTDNGITWEQKGTALLSNSVYCMATNVAGHIFAGTQAGVYRTTDNGNNWQQINTGLPDVLAQSLVIAPNGHAFVGTATAISRSTNNGATWVAVKTWSSNQVTELGVDSSGNLVAGTEQGMYRSVNDGDAWFRIGVGLQDSVVYSLAIDSRGKIFAGTAQGYIYRSTNGGDQWTRVFDPAGGSLMALVINSSDHIFAGASGGGVYRSMDGGWSWGRVNSGLTNTDVKSLVVDTRGRLFAGTNGSGVFRTTYSTLPPRITLIGASLRFEADSSGSLPASQTFSISNTGGGALDWSLSKKQPWLTILSSNGQTLEGTSTPVIAGIYTTNLSAGTYTDTIVVTSSSADNSPQKIAVTYVVEALPRIALGTQAITLTADSGAGRPAQTVSVLNTGGGTLKWRITKKQPWLTVVPDSGIGNNSTTTLSIASTDLIPGIYRDTLVITGIKNETGIVAMNSPQKVAVSFTVNAVTQLALNKWSLMFAADSGAGIPPTQALLVSNPGVGTLQWTATKRQPWISISPDGGTGNNTSVTIGILAANLSPGTYRDTIEITGSKVGTGQPVLRSPQRVAVAYVVGARAILLVNKSSVSFSADSGVIAPPEQSVLLTNRGAGTLRWSSAKKQSWLGVSPAGDSSNSSTVALRIVETRLAPGAYADTLVISGTKKETGSDALSSPICIVVSFTVGARARLVVDKPALVLVADSGGVLPDSARLAITNVGAGTLRWSVSKTQGWVKLSQDSDTTNDKIILVWVSSTNMPPGIFRDTLTIVAEKMETGSSAVNSPLLVPLTYRVYALPKILLSAQELRFVADSGNFVPPSQRLVVRNAGEKALQWSATKSRSWLDIRPTAGSTNSDTVVVGVVSTNLSPGIYADTIKFYSTNASNSPQQTSVVYRVIINHPPAPFLMLKPLKKDTLALVVPPRPLDFRWQAARDPDIGDTIRYAARVTGIGYDTLITALKDTVCTVLCMHLLRPGTVYYAWVAATDGWKTVYSDTASFRTSAQVTDVQREPTLSAAAFDLRQNYPNPFNPSTTISYILPKTAVVSLRVFDALGRELTLLVNEQKEAGFYQVTWSSDVPSGVYFYRLQATQVSGGQTRDASTSSTRGFVETKKMILLR